MSQEIRRSLNYPSAVPGQHDARDKHEKQGHGNERYEQGADVLEPMARRRKKHKDQYQSTRGASGQPLLAFIKRLHVVFPFLF